MGSALRCVTSVVLGASAGTLPAMSRLRLYGTLAALAMLTLIPVSADAFWRPPGTKYCGLQGGTSNSLIDRVFVRGVSCKTGRRVIRLTKSSPLDPGPRWDCRLYDFADRSQGSRCVNGKRKRVYGIPTDQTGGP